MTREAIHRWLGRGCTGCTRTGAASQLCLTFDFHSNIKALLALLKHPVKLQNFETKRQLPKTKVLNANSRCFNNRCKGSSLRFRQISLCVELSATRHERRMDHPSYGHSSKALQVMIYTDIWRTTCGIEADASLNSTIFQKHFSRRCSVLSGFLHSHSG